MNSPFLTIITVTYNDLKGFLKTYKSLSDFKDEDIQWIIKDGGSEEKIIKEIIKITSHKNIKFISSRDNGTYDAMNKALNLATGQWLIFMNGGDSFTHKNIFNTLINFVRNKKLNSNKKNIILGNYNLIYEFGKKNFVRFKKISSCKGINSYRMPTCHQAQFFSRGIYSNLEFRLNLIISADHAYFWEAVNAGAVINYLDATICDFNTGGQSYNNNIESIRDVYYSLKHIQKVNVIFRVLAVFKRFLAFYFILLHELFILKFR